LKGISKERVSDLEGEQQRADMDFEMRERDGDGLEVEMNWTSENKMKWR
jgi:hypothetical protein